VIREHLEQFSTTPSSRTLKISLVSSIVILLVAVPLVINTLEGSGYPGELERTQLGFDSEYIRDCFSSMTEEGIRLFIIGNLADYIFMVSYGAMLFSSVLLVTRRFKENTLARSVGYCVSFLGVLASISDGLENIFIISMALNPIDFPRWYAIPHSLFAFIKFNLMYVTTGWIILALIYLAIKRVIGTTRHPRIKQPV
jgi:hypothetical protein